MAANAAGALWYLARSASNKNAIREAKGEASAAFASPLRPVVVLRARASLNPNTPRRAARAAGIPPLIALLSQSADLDVTAKAAAALWSLADSSNTNKDCIRENEGIAPLVALLSAGPDRKATVKAAGALGSLAFNHANKARPRRLGSQTVLLLL